MPSFPLCATERADLANHLFYPLIIPANGLVGYSNGSPVRYGVPETYVIDKQGIIRYKQIGPVNYQNLRETILPLVAELQKK